MAFPSTFVDIQNAVIKKARLDPVADLQATKDWINQIYTQVCIEAEQIVSTTTLALTANQSNATMPAAVKRLHQMFLTPAGQTSVLEQPPLKRTTLDDILLRRQVGGITAQVGRYPTHFAVVGINDLELWPTPAAADVLTIFYVAAPTPLSANSDVPAIDEPYASKLLEYGALVEAGDFKGDPNTAEWQAEFGDWLARWANHLERQEGDIPGQGHSWGNLDYSRVVRGW